MPSIAKRLKSAYENVIKVRYEDDFFKARKLLNNATAEIKEVENAILKKDYPSYCFPNTFSILDGSHEEFKKCCENCIEHAEVLIEGFYNKELPEARNRVKRLAQSELDTGSI